MSKAGKGKGRGEGDLAQPTCCPNFALNATLLQERATADAARTAAPPARVAAEPPQALGAAHRAGPELLLVAVKAVERAAHEERVVGAHAKVVGELDDDLAGARHRHHLGAGAVERLALPGVLSGQRAGGQAAELDAVLDRDDLLVEQVVRFTRIV